MFEIQESRSLGLVHFFFTDDRLMFFKATTYEGLKVKKCLETLILRAKLSTMTNWMFGLKRRLGLTMRNERYLGLPMTMDRFKADLFR